MHVNDFFKDSGFITIVKVEYVFRIFSVIVFFFLEKFHYQNFFKWSEGTQLLQIK